MNQRLLNEALNNINSKRISAEKTAKENLEKALKNDDFKKLYYAYTSTMIENAKKDAFGEKYEKNELQKIEKTIKQKLKDLKLEPINPNYSCIKCNDSGYIENKYCDCLKKEITRILFKNSGFKKLNDFKDSNFEIFENKEEMKKIYEVLKAWCNKDSDKNLVYLLGQTGTGKTHLLSSMANEFIKQNKIVFLTTAFNLSQLFLKYHTTKEKDVLDEILSCEVLFIDDLGTEPFLKNITQEYTYLVINERRMKNLRTIITSNLTPLELKEKYDERIFSRILDKSTSITLELKGKDKRFVNKK